MAGRPKGCGARDGLQECGHRVSGEARLGWKIASPGSEVFFNENSQRVWFISRMFYGNICILRYIWQFVMIIGSYFPLSLAFCRTETPHKWVKIGCSMKSSRRWEFTQGMAKSVHFVSTVSTLALKVDGTIIGWSVDHNGSCSRTQLMIVVWFLVPLFGESKRHFSCKFSTNAVSAGRGKPPGCTRAWDCILFDKNVQTRFARQLRWLFEEHWVRN